MELWRNGKASGEFRHDNKTRLPVAAQADMSSHRTANLGPPPGRPGRSSGGTKTGRSEAKGAFAASARSSSADKTARALGKELVKAFSVARATVTPFRSARTFSPVTGRARGISDIEAPSVFHGDPRIDPLRVKTDRGFRAVIGANSARAKNRPGPTDHRTPLSRRWKVEAERNCRLTPCLSMFGFGSQATSRHFEALRFAPRPRERFAGLSLQRSTIGV